MSKLVAARDGTPGARGIMPRMTRALVAPVALALAVVQLSCAASGLTPLPQSMPAARAALRPEYRIFYDTLTDYGDWTLIEPYGFVFRPRVHFATWQPYSDGFWVPTDVYGWVWVSSEPFGWATYHYGQWFLDSFQGWVWMPGLDWAPAWVDWRVTDNYVGWAPLGPNGTASASSYRFVEPSHARHRDQSQGADRLRPGAWQGRGSPRSGRPVRERRGATDGVRFNRGPQHRVGGASRRPAAARPDRRSDSGGAAAGADGDSPRRAEPVAPAPRRTSVAAVRRAAERATSDARAVIRSESRVASAPLACARSECRAARRRRRPASRPRSDAKPKTGAKASAPDTTR